MNKQWKEYYSRFPDIFMEKYLNIKLSPFKKLMIRLYNSRLDKFAISDMRKFYNPQSSVYMNMYFWSSMGSKYGYDRCKMAEEVIKMKGRQLTLEEVLNLEDGTKVWVEDRDEGDEQVGTIVDEDDMLKLDDGGWFYLSDLPLANFVTFYEWIEEEPKEIISTYKSVSEIMESMANEICNLRGLDLTEDNIRLIIEEFS